MKKRVQVFAVERKESVYEGGRKSVRFMCQCLVHGEKMEVGVLRVPADLVGGDDAQILPGEYEAEFDVVVDWKTRDIVGRLSTFVGVRPLQAPPEMKARAAAPAP